MFSSILAELPIPHIPAESPVASETWQWAVPQVDKAAPSSRGGQTASFFKGKIFVFGGHFLNSEGKFEYENSMFVLDVDKNTWTCVKTLGDSPSPRYNHSACTAGSRIVYFGGMGPENNLLRDLHAFDCEELRWYQGPRSTSATPSGRHGHSSVLFEGKLVFFGGTNNFAFFDDVPVLDLVSMSWTLPETTGDKPTGRAMHACVLIGNKMIIHGGIASTKNVDYLADLRVLDLNNLVWSRLRAHGTLPSPRYGHSLNLTENNRLILFGGWQGLLHKCSICGQNDARSPQDHLCTCPLFDKTFSVSELPGSDQAFSFDLKNLEWKAIKGGGEKPPRYGHSAVPIGPHLIVFGGWDGTKALGDVIVLRNLSN